MSDAAHFPQPTHPEAGGLQPPSEVEVEGYEAPTPGGWEDYPLDDMAIRDERRSASDIMKRMANGRFVLDPDFQRGFVWKEDKQSRLIESILMRVPLPVFYVAEDQEGRFVVVDGRQRLTTIARFLNNKLALKLPERKELHGKTFADLDQRLRDRVEECNLVFYIIDRKAPERARLDIFERVNGGEVLTRQQMRNALYNGPATVFLREEAESRLFIRATGGSLNVNRMLDREFVNRFCSFSLLPLASYKGDMDQWLAQGLKTLAALSDAEKEHLRTRFRRTLTNNLNVFGRHAFRKHRDPDQGRSVINASLYDVMTQGLADQDETLVLERADALRAAFYARMGDATFTHAITYGPNSPNLVRQRFEIAATMFAEVFGA